MSWPRSQWTTIQPGWTRMPGAQPHVFVHHVGGDCPPSPSIPWLQQFEKNALAAGNARGDSYIAVEYHRGVFQDGTVVEFRPNGAMGGATINNNQNSYALCAMGNFETAVPTAQLIAGLRGQIAEWRQGGQLTPDAQVIPHNAVFGTACPGRNILAVMDQIRAAGPVGDDVAQIDSISPVARDTIKDAVASANNAVIGGLQTAIHELRDNLDAKIDQLIAAVKSTHP